MRLVLPPSETKRDGGDTDSRLDLTLLSFPALTPERRSAVRALRALSRNLTTMAGALRVGPGQKRELLQNRALTSSGTMAALDRYTGVLYDGLDAASLDDDGRGFAGRSVVIASALFGIVGADDPIPAYRLSHDSRLPGIRLRTLWADRISAELERMPGLVLDLRSDAYAALGPLPVAGPASPARSERFASVRVVAERPDGTRRALNHFNKKGKGELVRAIVAAAIDHPDVPSLLEWAKVSGIRLDRGGAGVLELTVDEQTARSTSSA